VTTKNRGKAVPCVLTITTLDAITLLWNDKPHTEVQLCPPDICCNSFQTRVDWEGLETQVSHDVCLASHTTCLTLVQVYSKVIKFFIVGRVLKST
jgi:hypothetical protein